MRMNLGSVIAEKRKKKKITQQELADFMNVSKASVSKWETGHTYPDITLLPLLAAYFNISIDELLNYEPQLSNQEIQHIYTSLQRSFETMMPEEVLSSIHSFIRRYYSCYPFILQMGSLILNHLDLLPGENQQEKEQRYFLEALELFVHVRTNAKDPELILQASRMEAFALLMMHKADEVLEILGDVTPANFPVESMIAAAFQMKGDGQKAIETMQSALYQHVSVMMSSFTNYLRCLTPQSEKFEETVKRGYQFAEVFDLEQLHPVVLLNFQLSALFGYAQQQKETEALDILEEFTHLMEQIEFPMKMHGDRYFDQLGPWFDSLETGTQMPRDPAFVQEGLVAAVVDNPMLSGFEDQARLQELIQRLVPLGGKKDE
ncbi:transcriptional regulator [Enterococcus florum]|uniref:Transcriptional regulator n=1 Tax=Enterococcus florum TaxID=2480627 RepID=A0A4P5P3X8_9ENTE|nr:helix-turn-helix transcriptional regulator [Enterococcus florum]GCF92457.1 transcriptional regulator [Enterococcus florum]